MKLKESCRFGLRGVNHLLWPAVCINCRRSICADDNLCGECWNQLLACTGADYCRRCGREAGRYAILQGSCPQQPRLRGHGIRPRWLYGKSCQMYSYLNNIYIDYKNSNNSAAYLYIHTMGRRASRPFSSTMRRNPPVGRPMQPGAPCRAHQCAKKRGPPRNLLAS